MALQRIQVGGDVRFIAAPFNALVEAVEKLQHMRGSNIAITYPGGVPNFEYVGVKGGGTSSAQSSYTGPWAVVRKDDTTATVKAQGDGYPCVSRVVAGLITTVHSTDADVTITVDGEVYLHVTVSGTTYTLAFANAATLPAQTAGNYYVSLARVEFADSKIGTITQIKTSDIEIVGRVV